MSIDDLDQIARLFRLRESGALTQAEFEAEKARVLNEQDSVHLDGEASAAQPVAPVEYARASPADEMVYEDQSSYRSGSPLFSIMLATILVIVAGLGWYVMRGNPSKNEQQAAANSSSAASIQEAPLIDTKNPVGQPPPADELSTATSTAPAGEPIPSVQEQPLDAPASERPLSNSIASGDASNDGTESLNGSTNDADTPEDSDRSETKASAIEVTQKQECQRLIARLDRGESRLMEFGFKAQVSRINGLTYAQTGPIIADAISATRRYQAQLRKEKSMACISVGNEGIALINSILRPLAGSD